MRSAEEDGACKKKQGIDLVSAVRELHTLSTLELSKLIRDAENNIIQFTTGNGSSVEINVEFLARYLALHLIAKLESFKQDEETFRYLLGGIRLTHTLCDLAPRFPKLEQILLDDFRVSEQILDLIFYTICVLGGSTQKFHVSTSRHLVLLHSSLLACSLYLLTSCISSQWHELVQVLLAHSEVDIFMSVAFAAIRVDIKFLQGKLSAQHANTDMWSNLTEVNRLCHHCEASLQFLQSLCQQKSFRERLVTNKDLCEEGGVLLLVQDIMKLPLCEDSYLKAVVSRMKSKVLSILLHLCEVESISFLDLAASTSGGLDLAKSTMFEVLELLKTMFRGDLKGLTSCSKTYPKGLLQLNAMRLTEILSDDSNFRSYIALNFTEVLTTVFSLPHGEFLSSWCSSELQPSEEDVTLDYDSLAASGWVLGVVPLSNVSDSTFNACRVPKTSYAHQRTSLLVKVVANLTCFVPDLCKEEKGLFLNKFLWCLQNESPKLPDGGAHGGGGGGERMGVVSRNLRSLLVHAESLIPGFLNEDDVQLLRMFIRQLEPLIIQEPTSYRVKEVHNRSQCSSPTPKKQSPDTSDGNKDVPRNSAMEDMNQLDFKGTGEGRSNRAARENPRSDAAEESSAAKGALESERDPRHIETIGADSSVLRLKNSVEGVPEDETVKGVQSEEKQLKKRKRNIMNDMQIGVIERALRDEPDMQRKAASIQCWAEKLSLHGSEVTSSQLKNWLNNRKAKLARAAAKDARVAWGGEDTFTDKQGGSGTDPVSDSAESPVDEFFDQYPSTAQGTQQKEAGEAVFGGNESSERVPVKSMKLEHGQYVVLADGQGEEVGKGCIHMASGLWFGNNLEEAGLCVVDVTYLKVDKWTNLPYPFETTGTTFGQAEQILGRKRVLWESTKLHPVQQQPR